MRYGIVIALTFLVFVPLFGTDSDSLIVARVNGAAITRQEFELFMPHDGWAKFEGRRDDAAKDSFAMVLRNALDRAIDVKLKKLLAESLHILHDASYMTFRTTWQQENSRRKEAKGRNEVVYGPVEFSERAFYDYQLSQIVLELQERFAMDHPDEFSERRIQAVYDSLRNTMFRRRDSLRLLEVRTSSTSPERLDAIKRDVERFDQSESLKSLHDVEASPLMVGDEMYRRLSEDRPAFMAAANALGSGDVSPWYFEGQRAWLVKCCERRPGGFYPLDDVHGVIRTRLIEAAYSRFLSVERAKAKVEIDRSVMDNIVEELVDGQQ